LGELVSLVGNLNKAVSNKQDSMEKSIQEYQEKLSKMEEVNKFLRKEINSPCTAINTISQQYQQLKEDEQRWRAEYEAMLEGRNQRILEIMNKN
jgi:septal ring factor EnvC (AmiA/AmiB activator)